MAHLFPVDVWNHIFEYVAGVCPTPVHDPCVEQASDARVPTPSVDRRNAKHEYYTYLQSSLMHHMRMLNICSVLLSDKTVFGSVLRDHFQKCVLLAHVHIDTCFNAYAERAANRLKKDRRSNDQYDRRMYQCALSDMDIIKHERPGHTGRIYWRVGMLRIEELLCEYDVAELQESIEQCWEQQWEMEMEVQKEIDKLDQSFDEDDDNEKEEEDEYDSADEDLEVGFSRCVRALCRFMHIVYPFKHENYVMQAHYRQSRTHYDQFRPVTRCHYPTCSLCHPPHA